MTVNVSKPQINLREKLSDLEKPSGVAGEAILRSETPQEVFNYINAGRRNLIINGAMQVAQRGTSVTGKTTTGYYTCDRFGFSLNSLGTWTIEQSTDAPSGFSNSFKVTATTADTPVTSDFALISSIVEAQDLQHLSFGSSDAKPITFSFWVKSNKAGTGTIELRQSDTSYAVTPSYTINTADTWEYKTITVDGNTVNSINNDNGSGIQIIFWINSGPTYTGGTHQLNWVASSNSDRNATNLGIGNATSDYFQITGVQLEVGSVATPFEHRSYGEELALCQRYYQVIGSSDFPHIWTGDVTSGNAYYNPLPYKNDLRATPTVTFSNSSNSNFGTVFSQVRSGSGRLYATATATAARAYYEQIVILDAEL
jgi:hypothetical protein